MIGWFDQAHQTYAIRPCCSLQDFLDPLLVVNVRFKRLIHLSWWCMPKDLLWKRKLGVLTALRVHRVIGHGSITEQPYWPCVWNSDLISCSLCFRSGFPWVTHKKRKFQRTQKNKAPEGNPLDIQTTSEEIERENERIAQLQLAFLRLLESLTW